MEPVVVKGMRIGEGVPKTIVSLMDADVDGLLASAERGKAAGVDCFEWRADFFGEVHDADAVVWASRALAGALPENPLLFTFRSAGQGGNMTIGDGEYRALVAAVVEDGCADMADIEVGVGEGAVRELAALARSRGVVPVVSFHDFQGTPSGDELLALLERMADLGAGIAKVAVMAHDAHDALELLVATERFARTSRVPALTMAMGAQGSITRLVGEQFGSALTFCSLERASAPGQVPVGEAKRIMAGLHGLLS